jgi:hypothetical protein
MTEYTHDVENDSGKTIGCVYVSLGKTTWEREIGFMPIRGKAFSVRSSTELMNKLKTMGISIDDRKEAYDFIATTLKYLNDK